MGPFLHFVPQHPGIVGPNNGSGTASVTGPALPRLDPSTNYYRILEDGLAILIKNLKA